MKWRLQKPLRGATLAQFPRRVAAFSSRLAPTQPHLDYSSSENAGTRDSGRLFVIGSGAHASMTLLPLPTGRKFSKKIFIFLRFGSKLAQILLDISILVIVRCNCDERGTEKSQRTRPEERCEGESAHPQPSRVQTDVPLETVTGDV